MTSVPGTRWQEAPNVTAWNSQYSTYNLQWFYLLLGYVTYRNLSLVGTKEKMIWNWQISLKGKIVKLSANLVFSIKIKPFE